MTQEDIKSLLEDKTTNVVYYSVRSGDTLKNIALRAYQDIDAAQVIAYYNNITSDDDLYVGLKLLLPFAEETAYFDLFDFYGTDFSLDENGDLNVSNNGEIQTISGINNIIAAVSNRIATQVDTYLRSLNYGIDVYIGKPQKAFYLKMIKVKVLSAILLDDRIQRIDSVDFNVKKTEIFLDIVMTTHLYDQIEVQKRLNVVI